MGNKRAGRTQDSVHLYLVAGRHLLSDAEWTRNAKKASIVAGVTGNMELLATIIQRKMSWDNPKTLSLKPVSDKPKYNSGNKTETKAST